MIAIGSADKIIRIWSVGKRIILLTILGHTASVTKVRWSPNTEKLASASDDNTVRIWDLRFLTAIFSNPDLSRPIKAKILTLVYIITFSSRDSIVNCEF